MHVSEETQDENTFLPIGYKFEIDTVEHHVVAWKLVNTLLSL